MQGKEMPIFLSKKEEEMPIFITDKPFDHWCIHSPNDGIFK